MNKSKLTEKQKLVLDSIVFFKGENQRMPTMPELAKITGISEIALYSKIDSLTRRKLI